MFKKSFIFFSLTALMFMLALCSCQTNKAPSDIHSPRTALDWEGIYTGTIPSASGPGIEVSIRLYKNLTYEMNYAYIGKPDGKYAWTGTFQWNDKGDVIKLGIDNTPPYYQVAEGKLIQLDMKGKLIKGKLADNYILTKVL